MPDLREMARDKTFHQRSKMKKIVTPQPGFQERFLSSSADVVIGGGKAGAGKSWSLVMDAARNTNHPKHAGMIFRRTTPQIKNKGGLWDESMDWYPRMNAKPSNYKLEWKFPSGAVVKFGHLEYEHNIHDHQGAAYSFLGFDEITHFTEKQFFYLLSRNRSKYTRPYCRATCNPDPDSWVADFIKWWIDQDTGFPIPERDGVLRYFTREGGKIIWGDTIEEVADQCPNLESRLVDDMVIEDLIKSATFIAGDIYENKALLTENPEYLGNLLAQDDAERERLLEGNWKVSQNEMALFDSDALNAMFEIELKEENPKPAVSGDVARFGSDLAVAIGWEGGHARVCRIRTKCDLTTYAADVEACREQVGCSKKDCDIDVDGLGAGVVDFGGYSPFQNAASPIDPPKAKKNPLLKANYSSLKTQCYYHLADAVNGGNISFKDCLFYVDGKRCEVIETKSGTIPIQNLIKREMRAIRRKNPDRDGKKQINNKEDQKKILNGMSPDFPDAIMISRKRFLKPKKRFVMETF